MSDRIRITDLMAVALTLAVPMGDELRVPMQFGGSAGTMKGLETRGLVENRFIANGDLPGYEGRYPKVKNGHWVLTPRGEAMRRKLAEDPSLKSVRTEELDRMAEPVTTACGSRNPANEKHTCKRESGHSGDCRPTISYVSSQLRWRAPANGHSQSEELYQADRQVLGLTAKQRETPGRELITRTGLHAGEVLDLYSCSGGFGKGLADAGFLVRGVDIEERPNYPFKFVQADALEYLRGIIRTGEVRRYSLISAGPPCQANAALTVGTNKSRGWGRKHIDLVAPTRELLDRAGVPYVIEQPNGKAPIRRDVTLCGEMFGLGVIRHRNFELGGWTTAQPPHIPHRGRVRGVRHGEFFDGPYVAAYGDGGYKATVPEMQEAMRITWTDVREELTEAVPPAYGEWIGRRFIEQL